MKQTFGHPGGEKAGEQEARNQYGKKGHPQGRRNGPGNTVAKQEKAVQAGKQKKSKMNQDCIENGGAAG